MKPIDPSVVINHPALKCLGPVLSKWRSLNARMGREWAAVNDTPWWYNERALVSLFAGAVWRCGGDAFEEFSNEKRRAKEIGGGRIDLWFGLGEREFNAEAKQCWIYSDDRRTSIQLARDAMARARDDAKCCIPDGRPRLAMVFGIALVPTARRSELKAEIASLVEIAKAPALQADATAWIFPTVPRHVATSDGFIYPGISLWIRKFR